MQCIWEAADETAEETEETGEETEDAFPNGRCLKS